MAKTLYDYWFVQFDFPDENGKPYRSSGGEMVWNEELKREIPKGWKKTSVLKIATIQYGYPFSTKCFTTKEKGVPVIRIRDIVENSISAYTSELVDKKYIVQQEDLLIGMDGNFQMNFWSWSLSYLNQRCFYIRQKKLISPLLIYFFIEPYIGSRVKNVTRTTVGHLGSDDIKNLYVIIPDNIILYKDMFILFSQILTHICHLKNENMELFSLRDWLLPMLMNGQVSIRDGGEKKQNTLNSLEEEPLSEMTASATNEETPVRKKRGRPRKNPFPQQMKLI